MTTGPLSTPPSEARNHPQNPWWVDAVIYQVYPRSFADADGDGMGDLAGVTAQLPYLEQLGVDAIWLSPFYVSPQKDGGYDVADYRDVDPRLGSLADAERLLETAHAAGLRVIVDLVPNHTSSAHPWFVEALAADPATEHGRAARDRYMFRPGQGPDGAQPPNNWQSTFGGPAWTRTQNPDGSPGDWYLHLFDTSQPDLNWQNPEVAEEFEDILRFWLDRGVDGFRVDVAHGLVKAEGLPDHDERPGMITDSTASGPATDADAGEDVAGHPEDNPRDHAHPVPYHDQDGVHEIYRDWNRVLARYSHEPMLVAEAWVSPLERLFRYVRPGEMQQAFNFTFLLAGWDAVRLSDAITVSLQEAAKVGAPNTWVLSNHDTVRHASRFGLTDPTRYPSGIGAEDEQPDEALGWKRARAAAMIELGLPGSAYLYQGDELGLPEHTTLEDSLRQDPTFFRTGGAEKGRDGSRVPMPWRAAQTGFGFSLGAGPGGQQGHDVGPAAGAAAAPWLPQPESYGTYAADRQVGVAGSTFELYRELLGLRGELDLGTGTFAWSRLHSPELGVLAFTVTTGGGQHGHDLDSGERIPEQVVLVLANLGETAVDVPEDYAAAIFSQDEALQDGRLMPDSAAWFLRR
ncbi:alpha-amylase family glycosyl hydrolase [Citricoccus sp. I39-566]|uniref:glycoside hydrolase family 13 protein n=1 Tax=Citricoccus sp. I39-566 TaxID=3073268 RepID=UPI00286CF120|nr:alpha-amylase family glycosyl hydrolase [Citricoccus sp. I39-566]WMY78962.1 alpha-amylase family glycosyl hydrolase [Citricoccus sp. I39-566]